MLLMADIPLEYSDLSKSILIHFKLVKNNKHNSLLWPGKFGIAEPLCLRKTLPAVQIFWGSFPLVLYWASKNENEPSHWNFPKFGYEPGRFKKSAWIKDGSNLKFFDSIYFWFLPHEAQFGSFSNFDIDFINFRFVFNTKLDRGRKILQLYDMLQF